jgi:predicted ferric reductase
VNDSLLWYATRGAGVVSLLLLSAVVVLGILGVRRFEAPGWPRFLTTSLHRNLALTAVVFLAIHVVTAVVDPYTHLGWVALLVPFGSYYRTFWLGLGSVGAYLIAAIVVTSLARRYIGPRAWRAIHWLAYASWPVTVLHSWGTGTDSGSAWLLCLGVVSVASVAAAAGARLLLGSPDPLAAEREGFRRRVTREPAG